MEEKAVPDECVLKVFKTTLNEFKNRDKYIKDDYRFKERFSKLNPRKIIRLWAEKEMHNLARCVVMMSLKWTNTNSPHLSKNSVQITLFFIFYISFQCSNCVMAHSLPHSISMKKADIPCPEVVILKKHILVMSFIGKDHVPAPKLKEAMLGSEDMNRAYYQVLHVSAAAVPPCTNVDVTYVVVYLRTS